MLGLLIIAVIFGIGFGSGYGVREIISRRRRRAARGETARTESQGGGAVGAGRDEAINLERLLEAANDDLSGRRPQPRSSQPIDQAIQAGEFDGAVRDLLGEFNRRPAEHSPHPSRIRG